MRARWDSSTKRWEASSGRGKSRKWFRSRIEGPDGEAKVNESLRLFEDGQLPALPGSLTDFMERVWWPRLEQRSKNTRIKYKSVVGTHFDTLNSLPIRSIRLAVLQNWVNSLPGQAKTVVTTYGVLRSILHLARQTGEIDNLDYQLVVLPEVADKDKPVVSRSEGDLLIAAAEGTSMEGPVWCAFNFAMRPGEVCGLKVPHVKFDGDNAVIRIQSNRQQWGEAEKLKNQKKGKVRTLTVPRWMGEKLLSFAPEGSLYIFNTKLGKPVQPAFMAKRIEDLCTKAGVTDLPFKNLRHSCATNLQKQGVEPIVIARILGHSKVQTSLVYIQQDQDQVLQALGGQE